MGGVRLMGVAEDDPVVTSFAATFGLRVRRRADLLDDPEVDAVLVHSTSREMVDHAVAALEAGKAVLVEKPGGRDEADLHRLVRATERTGGVCQIGYTFGFSDTVALTGTVLRRGLLGSVHQVRVHGGSSLGEAGTDHLNRPGDLGGAFFVIGCHQVDLVVRQFGMPAAVNAVVVRLPASIPGAHREDVAAAVFHYPDRVVTLDFSAWDPLPWFESWEMSVYGTDGVLHSGLLPHRSRLYLSRPGGGLPAGWSSWRDPEPQPWSGGRTPYSPEMPEIAHSALFDRECAAFVAAARGLRPTAASARHGLDVVRCLAAGYRSAAQGGAPVHLRPEQHLGAHPVDAVSSSRAATA
ncbi:Gfo/Idh/MocA family oxidoreductase [Nakamurella flavida]|uniref:Gfo/Idh/MocA family oxidoreductase n=2 Tax=Nakamurella flavida TaxID=363630 RepID=A0A938YFZ2_9ACTN|nr:Gfo/Idh/MocA family oxidoreductase [Nakamurella flavida]